MLEAPPLAPALLEELRGLLPGARSVLTSREDLLVYGYDGTWYEGMPQVVVIPESTDQVAAVVLLANRELIPVTPRAMGSSLSGGPVPRRGGIVIDTKRMDRILEIDEVNFVAVVQPGVINSDLQAAVERRGLFYPPDPSSLRQSAIGGNIAENAGGSRCLKYGVTSDYVMGLEVVLPTGEVIRTGGKMVKNVTGYNLRQLITGAEGTLGVVTEATLRLIKKPPHARTAMFVFASIVDAAQCVTAVMSAGLLPTAIEMMDDVTMACVEEMFAIGLPVEREAILLISVDGHHAAVVDGELAAITEIAAAAGAVEVRTAANQAEADALWQARRGISPALARKRPNKLGEDVSIPRSEIPHMVRAVREIARKYGLPIPIYGHVGDGNLHPNILCDRHDGAELERVGKAAREIFEAAVACGGTLSGEHGIGLLKKQFLELDLGSAQVEAMRRIKAALDPNGIMNPGKIFPEPGGADIFKL